MHYQQGELLEGRSDSEIFIVKPSSRNAPSHPPGICRLRQSCVLKRYKATASDRLENLIPVQHGNRENSLLESNVCQVLLLCFGWLDMNRPFGLTHGCKDWG